ncbi:hypothetical protein [Paracraurococcus lichenis]|uniref:Uncharacterized protein n=1 Tax=Paracraurococcus lichenis TaxID=3064888 RepID=A0ABT9E298_9PROT|nr:hypothetical protein [Paracraurococcus sp. LOR1-02]MDO9710268.1 hypothetical protein [Paracraurococcus sp. LOR1-02]
MQTAHQGLGGAFRLPGRFVTFLFSLIAAFFIPKPRMAVPTRPGPKPAATPVSRFPGDGEDNQLI